MFRRVSLLCTKMKGLFSSKPNLRISYCEPKGAKRVIQDGAVFGKDGKVVANVTTSTHPYVAMNAQHSPVKNGSWHYRTYTPAEGSLLARYNVKKITTSRSSLDPAAKELSAEVNINGKTKHLNREKFKNYLGIMRGGNFHFV